jgi:PIN domain nuclease of toxin-antitoxin system
LSSRVASALEDPANQLWISPLTTWEVLVLADKGRVRLEPTAAEWLRQVFRTIPFREAPMTHEIALHSRSVSLTHEDPVDRFLAATALVYDLTLVTADERLLRARGFSTLPNK